MSARPLILIGLPGAGKSTVGALVAERLGRPLVDLDARIEQEAGSSVAEIFRLRGEAEFRRRERTAMATALRGGAPVVAAGGGWAAQSDNMDAARTSGALIAWLDVAPALALARTRIAGGRPLLEGPDAAARMEALLTERRDSYSLADVTIRNDGTDPEVAARALIAWLREEGHA